MGKGIPRSQADRIREHVYAGAARSERSKARRHRGRLTGARAGRIVGRTDWPWLRGSRSDRQRRIARPLGTGAQPPSRGASRRRWPSWPASSTRISASRSARTRSHRLSCPSRGSSRTSCPSRPSSRCWSRSRPRRSCSSARITPAPGRISAPCGRRRSQRRRRRSGPRIARVLAGVAVGIGDLVERIGDLLELAHETARPRR